MDKSLHDLLYGLSEQMIAYLPNLVGGLVLIAIGWLLAWLVKRVVAQLCVILHVERLAGRFRWGRGLTKADVRYALYGWVGGVAGLVVFLVFLNAALVAMRLTVLSNLIQEGVVFIPRLVIALAIFGLGYGTGNLAASGVLRSLRREGIPRATLVGRFVKLILVLFFSAMAFTEIGISRPIIVIGFTVTLVTLCLLALILVTLSGREFAERVFGRRPEEQDEGRLVGRGGPDEQIAPEDPADSGE
jgi:hypothetical protein